MADPIPFPAGPKARPPYRTDRVAAAVSDAQAERQVVVLTDRHRVESRSRRRLVAQSSPYDGPVAGAIRLLDDRPPPGP